MKKCLFVAAMLIMGITSLVAQAPQQFNYQAIVRGNTGTPLANNTPVALRFTIRNGSAGGASVFTETQNTTTNQFGLVNVQIGSVGNLSTVNWGSGAKFLQVETDVNNTGTFTDMGTTQLISVPYALYAANAPVGATGPTGAAGSDGAQGPTGPTGFIADGATAGNTPYWDGTAWVLNSSNIYNNGGNVGIGESSPNYTLEINDSEEITASVKSSNVIGAQLMLDATAPGGGQWRLVSTANGAFADAGALGFFNSSTGYQMVVKNNGNVGIGTTTPTTTLDVNGQVRISGGNPGAGKVLTSNAIGLATWETPASPLPANPNAGDMVYYNGANWALVPVGQAGQFLQLSPSLVPTWTNLYLVPTITSPQTGRVWMDRNLGASRVAMSKTDALALGYLFQWGRGADGHEDPNSAITSTRSVGDNPGNGNFIIDPQTPNDWRLTTNNSLWQTATGNNNPCPDGFRIPTNAEWQAEFVGFAANDNGAYNSFLKLPEGQDRNSYVGNVTTPGVTWYWSSTLSGNSPHHTSYDNFINAWQMQPTQFRAQGWPVRCIAN